MGGTFTQSSVDDAGTLAALDVRTNKLVWRQRWREICYSGVVVTRGGLLFVGRSDGRLTALDKTTGAQLWEFMTDGGVNTTVTTFEHKGRQMVVVHAGGGVFADGRRGDGGSTLVANPDVALLRAVTTTGRNNMPTFREIYDADQSRDVAEYIRQVLAARR